MKMADAWQPAMLKVLEGAVHTTMRSYSPEGRVLLAGHDEVVVDLVADDEDVVLDADVQHSTQLHG